MISHITQKVTRTAALLVILIISAVALGACFQSVYPAEGPHHASADKPSLPLRYRGKSFQPGAPGEATTPLAANRQNKAGLEEGRRGGSCSLQSAPPQQQPRNPTFSSPQFSSGLKKLLSKSNV